MHISEPDWKILKQIHALALERLCERILAEAAGIATGGRGSAHERYQELFQLIRERDRELGDAFDDLRRSKGVLALMKMHALGLVSEEEFARFSAETRRLVLMGLGRLDSTAEPP